MHDARVVPDGNRRRPLLCVSGLGGSASEWSSVASALARHGDLTVIALPPSGEVGAIGRHGPLQCSVRAIDAALASTPQRSVLIGHSMGALASMLVAANQPPQLAGLVLTNPFLPAARNGRSTLATAADYARHRVLFLTGARDRRRQPRQPTVDRGTRAAGLRALAHYGLRPDAFHAVADRVSCPVLLAHGDDDHYVPPAFARAAAARHPTWRPELIPGAGHFARRGDESAWLTAVEPWLRRLAPG